MQHAPSNHRLLLLVAAIAAIGLVIPAQAAEPPAPRSATYKVNHTLTVKDIPAGSKSVRVWFWVPDDDESQKVLDLVVTQSTGNFKITRDSTNGHRYLYAEVANPNSPTLSLGTDFTIRRSAVDVPLDPAKAGVITDAHRKMFAEYLRTDTPYMAVDATVAKLAEELCGPETNVVHQVRKLFDYTVDNTHHYSKEGAPKSSGKGSVTYCLDAKGGGCTDQHALFMAMARARGIPTRLHFGSRLQTKNEGKDVDPGYRCWVTYFVPNYGWVPMDISAANTTPAERNRFMTGLDERRIRFAEGRDLDMAPAQQGPRVNLLITAYIEVDGKSHSAFDRVLKFTEVKSVQ